MKLISYQRDNQPRIAAESDGLYVDLCEADPSLPSSLKQLLAQGEEALSQAKSALVSGTPFELDPSTILPPILDPQKIICVGLNYADHAKETGAIVGDEPVIFNKFPTTLRANGEPIELPPASDQVDYEAELVAVIGLGGKNIPREQALSRVAGYTCGHDVSARDWQKGKPGGQWLLGKSFDSFAPCGPHLITADEIGDPGKLKIEFRLNGETLQSSNTEQLIFPVDQLVAYLSTVVTLLPGDLIYTGTPSGVGAARSPQIFLKPGDTAEVEIEKIGILSNPVIAASTS